MSVNDIITYRGKGYVAFLDILGFKNAIRSAFHNEDGFDEIHQVIRFNRRFMPDDLPGATIEWRRSAFNGMARLFLFSDSYVICLQEGKIKGHSLIGMASHICYIWTNLIKLGYTIRGGIDYNDAYWDERTITGPALIDAYHIEGEISKCSRIVLSAAVIEQMKAIESSNPFRKLLDKYFMSDDDGETILNPKMLADDDVGRIELIRCLEHMRDRASVEKAQAKYHKLISILNQA